MAYKPTPSWSPAFKLGLTVGDVIADKNRRAQGSDYRGADEIAGRCAAMDQDGVRCNVIELTPKYVGYHGDPETNYNTDAKEQSSWVLVPICQWHRTSWQSAQAHEYDVNGLKREAR